MAEKEYDPLKEEANQTFSDQLIDIGTNVAAAGVAAASFYRMGGARFLSRNSRYFKAIRYASKEVRHLDYDHTNQKVLEDTWKNVKEAFKKGIESDNGKITLPNHRGTAIESLMTLIKNRIESDSRWEEREIELRERIIEPVFKKAQEALNKRYKGKVLNKYEEETLDFIRKVSRDITGKSDLDSIGRILQQYRSNRSGSNADIIQASLNHIQQLKEATEQEKIKRTTPGINQQIAEILSKAEAHSKRFKPNRFINTLLGDRELTLGEYLDDPEKFNEIVLLARGKKTKDPDKPKDAFTFHEELQKFMKELKDQGKDEEYEKFRNLVISPTLRISRSGEIYSFNEYDMIGRDALNIFANSLPGRILKLRSFEQSEGLPTLARSTRGAVNAFLASYEKSHGLVDNSDGLHIQNTYYTIAGDVYRYGETGELELLKNVKPSTLISARYGAESNIYKDIFGLNAERILEEDSLYTKLGIGTSTEARLFEGLLSGSKDPRYVPNIIRDIRNGTFSSLSLEEQYERISEVNKFLEEHTRGLSDSAIYRLNNSNLVTAQSKEYLDILQDADTETDLINSIMRLFESKNGADQKRVFKNERLQDLADSLFDFYKAQNSVKLDADITQAWSSGMNVGLNFKEQLEKEISREAILEMMHNDNSLTNLKRVIESANMSSADERLVKDFAYSSVIDNETGYIFTSEGARKLLKDDTNVKTETDLARSIFNYEKYLSGHVVAQEGEEDVVKHISNLIKDNHGIFHKAKRDTINDMPSIYIEDDFVHIAQSTGPFNILKSINESIKENSIAPFKETIFDFAHQLVGGRPDGQHVSRLTMVPYFLLARLGDSDLPSVLQFTNAEKKNVVSLAGAIAKRLGAVAIGGTYLEWGDDTFGEITGTKASAGVANSFAYMDLGARRVLDATGIGDFINEQFNVNPILQYWGGRDGYYDYNKELDYYQNGYEAVRKGRYWSFGSVNEFRGSQIQYYRPNLVRRLNSDYYNKSLYSSYWDKWGHSLLPTPTMPISPLIYMMDPYYLENEHYYDRPYPVTGTMFEKNTPWGIILNPTIGELIKPIQPMHQEDLEDGVDVKAIIYGINKSIRDMAAGADSYGVANGPGGTSTSGGHAYAMIFDRDQITSGEFTSLGSPSIGETHIRLGKTRGEEMREAQEATLGSLEPQKRRYLYGEASEYENSPLDLLGQMNRGIKEAARSSGEGILTTDRIRYSKLDYYLENSEDINDLITAGKGQDLIQEASVSLRLISGIYGYGMHRAFGFGESDGKQIADAGDISSYTRSFWDESLGGLGGGLSEIGRRFIPEFRRNIRQNPLMNNMPDWLPETLKFGDPYCITFDTLVEVNELGFVQASDIIEGDILTTHYGNREKVQKIAIREINSDEKIYEFKIASLSAIESKFSENHPILCCKNPKNLKNGYNRNGINKIKRLNSIIECLKYGITRKKEISIRTGISIDWLYMYLSVLSDDGIIENYKDNKDYVIPKNLESYNITEFEKRLEWVKAKEINIGDYVAYPVPKLAQRDVIIDLAEILDYPYSDNYIYVSGTLKNNETIEIYEWFLENGVPKFERGKRKEFLEKMKWNTKSYESAQNSIRTNKYIERMNRRVVITPELCYSIGLYLAEGYTNNASVSYALNIKEKELFNRALNGVIGAGFKPSSHSFKRNGETNGATGTIYCKSLAYFMSAMVNKFAHNKSINNKLAHLTRECILRFFEGYFDGDGSNFKITTGESQKDSYKVSLSTCNIKLALQIRKLALSIGYVFSLDKKPPRNRPSYINGKRINSGMNYSLNIRGENAVRFTKEVWNQNLVFSQARKPATHSFIKDGYVYMRVGSIKEYTKDDFPFVYGFQMGNSKSFCTAGLATHNTSIPMGEARLPGKGYEALNKLHSDEYGYYGSYDRFKILADVAPSSAEFKIWKQIARETVKDPALIEDMQKIQERVNEANKVHDFFNYRVLGESVNYEDVIIRQVHKDGTFKIQGSNELYKIAGIETKAGAQNRNVDRFQTTEEQVSALEAMKEYIYPGQTVRIAVDANEYHVHNNDAFKTVNAAVFVDGISVAQELIENHGDVFQQKKSDFNAADTYALTSSAQRFVGGLSEAFAHLDVPWFHDKFLRVRTPLESYKAEQVYGTPYQTWSDITGTYIFPAIERSVSDSWEVVKSTAEYFALMALREREGIGGTQRMMLSGLASLMNRGAFIGSAITWALTLGNGSAYNLGQKIGAAGMILGNLYTSTQSNILDAGMSWGMAGYMVGDLLDETKEQFIKSEDLIDKIWRTDSSFKKRAKYALAGAAIGVALKGIAGPSAFSDRDKWIPDRVKEKWELEDYFDRLEYIKYMGLYHRAAEKAKSEEGTDIEKIFSDHEAYQKYREEIMAESDLNNPSQTQLLKFRARKTLASILGIHDNNSHRFEYSNGFSINDLPGVRNGVFHSEEISEEERLFTLNALVTMGIRYGNEGLGSERTNEDRDLTALTDFKNVYGIDIPEYYQVHHIVQFSKNGPDDPSNLIALHPDDHLYITEAHERYWSGDFSAAKIGARTALHMGEYARAAILYKKAAESTMYGLQANARWTDVVKALPKYERDYFTEFMKEKDPEKQEEILQMTSPFMRRALKQVWHMDYESEMGPSNEEYFQNHYLPNFLWEGWRPDSDLNKVKAKTIKNEGLLFSDFGIYESQYRDQEIINAPNITPQGTQDPITLQANLQATLNGLGLHGVEVSVEPKSTKGVQSIINLTRVIEHNIGNTINEMFA